MMEKWTAEYQKAKGTNLTVPEIADHLYLSVNTIRTHTRHIYDKLGAHRRHEAVELARDLGLLAPPA